MDRNLWWGVRKAVGSLVALRKESVDRNFLAPPTMWSTTTSLSARRAWIEISITQIKIVTGCVSLSARRAWIEISTQCKL